MVFEPSVSFPLPPNPRPFLRGGINREHGKKQLILKSERETSQNKIDKIISTTLGCRFA